MARIRVKLAWKGDVWGVDLPTFTVVSRTFRPVTPALMDVDGPFALDPVTRAPIAVATIQALGPTVEVDVPDEDMDPVTGRPSAARIRARYAAHPRYGRANFVPDV